MAFTKFRAPQFIVPKSINTDLVADKAVTEPLLADSAVIERVIGDAAVTTNKVMDKNITLAKLADQSVDSSKLVRDGNSIFSLTNMIMGDSGKVDDTSGDATLVTAEYLRAVRTNFNQQIADLQTAISQGINFRGVIKMLDNNLAQDDPSQNTYIMVKDLTIDQENPEAAKVFTEKTKLGDMYKIQIVCMGDYMTDAYLCVNDPTVIQQVVNKDVSLLDMINAGKIIEVSNGTAIMVATLPEAGQPMDLANLNILNTGEHVLSVNKQTGHVFIRIENLTSYAPVWPLLDKSSLLGIVLSGDANVGYQASKTYAEFLLEHRADIDARVKLADVDTVISKDTSTDAKVPSSKAVTDYVKTSVLDQISTDATMGGADPSDAVISSQKAVKTYVDTSDQANLTTAKAYTDSRVGAITEADVDKEIDKALADAKSYADTLTMLGDQSRVAGEVAVITAGDLGTAVVAFEIREGTEQVYVGGLRMNRTQNPGQGNEIVNDYTVDADKKTVKFNFPLTADDIVVVDYRKVMQA